VDDLSHLDIDIIKIQEETEEALTFLSGSENCSICNIKITIQIHTSLIFKQQTNIMEPHLREKQLDQLHYSMQHIEWYDLLWYKSCKQGLHPSIIEPDRKEYSPGTMNIYFIRDTTEQKRLSGIP
jgi:hypothetical protein